MAQDHDSVEAHVRALDDQERVGALRRWSAYGPTSSRSTRRTTIEFVRADGPYVTIAARERDSDTL